MPDSILLSTRLHPFPGGHGGACARPRFDFESIHDARGSRESESKCSAGREVIFKRVLRIEKARAVVDSLHFDARAATCTIIEPGHQQMTAAPAIFQNIASELRYDGRDHGHLCGSKRLPELLVELDVHHRGMQVGFGLNVKAAERRPRRIRGRRRAPVQVRVRFRHGLD